MVVILGDNIFEKSIADFAAAYRRQPSGAKILLQEVDDPGRYGVAVTEGHRVVRIIEKPKDPPSRLAVTGIYFYDASVYEIISGLAPSKRGELEITDVNNAYIARGDLTFDVLPGWWTDAGTFESLKHATDLVGSDRPALTGTARAQPRPVVFDPSASAMKARSASCQDGRSDPAAAAQRAIVE